MAIRLSRPTAPCRRCLRPLNQNLPATLAPYSSSSDKVQSHPKGPSSQDEPSEKGEKDTKDDKSSTAPASEPGAMSRRLEEATTEALLTGGRAGRQAVQDAGFSEELKEKLFDKVQGAKFRNQFSSAFATAGLPATPGAGSNSGGPAVSQPWTGEERTEDAVLRMLDDAKKPLRPGLRGKFQPPPVDMRIRRDPVLSPSERVASARDKASMYSGMGLKERLPPPSSKETKKKKEKEVQGEEVVGLTDEEKEQRRQHFRERFQPGARAMPNSISGLAALANERIENAIARGQFKNIPRGKGIERDTRADNPFIDTTEYIMNKMIQRQDIVPPWIEKQQDLVKAAHTFRTRLRNDWKRHAARMIASRGGSLLAQMSRAEAYARSESLHNPMQRLRKVEDIPISTSLTDDPVMVKMRQQVKQLEEDKAAVTEAAAAATATVRAETSEKPGQAEAKPETDAAPAPLLPPPFRDPEWEKAESKYMQLSIDNLNSITRAYNLMAPDLAKKPYYSLQRELLSAYADVAPQLANEIKERATRPTNPGLGAAPGGGNKEGFLEYLGGGANPRIHLEADEKAYGLKEWWRDFWSKGSKPA